MDDLVQKAQIFRDILIAARGQGAADWSMEDLERAYGWAGYFEQAYARIRSKPQIADRLDRRLKVLTSTEASPLGYQQFSLQLLGEAKQFVDQALLQNSHLPPMLYSVVLQRCVQNMGNKAQLRKVQSTLLVKVAAVYFSFYKSYLGFLVEWGKDMVVTGQSQQGRTWRHRKGADHYSFDELLSRVLSLLEGPAHVATATLKSIQSLPAPATSPRKRTIWEEIFQTPQVISIIQTKNLQE
uniref:Uncharacterized protein n=1 Tax=Branchiostoma floridae TaxID=7739 RepID=C3YZR3_BRAFL|eukprot:XP_002598322.1 hypothetical protein BRAFLDRAFT_69676 [Branchiostoma floridae]